MASPKELSAGFAISTESEHIIKDNASDRFQEESGPEEFRELALAAGYMDKDGNITQAGWDTLNDDIGKIEENAMRWLRTIFRSVRDEGHGGHDGNELIGTVWWSPRSKKQKALIVEGQSERIDLDSFGGTKFDMWKGTSGFSNVLSSVYLEFFDTGIDEDGNITRTE